MLKIGERIRAFRLQHGLSQGDVEERTGLLRCYLSRVENGHTIPSLQTLARIASALDMPLSDFFVESETNGEQAAAIPQLSEDAVAFLTQMRRYAASLNEHDREQVLAMVRRMAINGPEVSSSPGSSS